MQPFDNSNETVVVECYIIFVHFLGLLCQYFVVWNRNIEKVYIFLILRKLKFKNGLCLLIHGSRQMFSKTLEHDLQQNIIPYFPRKSSSLNISNIYHRGFSKRR